jgi:hypothetical protein
MISRAPDALAEAVNNIIQRKQKFWMAYRCAHATFSDEPLVVSDDLREAVTLAWSSEAVREYTVQRMQVRSWGIQLAARVKVVSTAVRGLEHRSKRVPALQHALRRGLRTLRV